MWIRELSCFCLSLALLQGLLLRPAPSYFPSTHLSSPNGHVCWLGPVSPSCFWVESLWSPVSSDTCTQSRSEPRPCSAALCVGSGTDAAGIAASLSSCRLLHLGRGAGALRLRLFTTASSLLLLLTMCLLGRSCAPKGAVILGAGRMQGKVSAARSRGGLGQGPSLCGPSSPTRSGDGAGPGCGGGSYPQPSGEQGRGSQVKARDLLSCRSELVHQALGPVQSPPPEMGTIFPYLCWGSLILGEMGQAERAVCGGEL